MKVCFRDMVSLCHASWPDTRYAEPASVVVTVILLPLPPKCWTYWSERKHFFLSWLLPSRVHDSLHFTHLGSVGYRLTGAP